MTPFRIALPETLSSGSLAALRDTLVAAAAAPPSGPWVLHGGEAAFCRGMDLAEVASTTGVPEGPRVFVECLRLLRHAPRPTIALVDGPALGGGMGILAACDLVIATPRASFALPEALLGLMPAIILPVLLERMTPQAARLLALTCTSRDAAYALRAGLVDEIVEPEALERRASRAARDLSRVPPRAVRDLRAFVDEVAHVAPDQGMDRGAQRTTSAVSDPEVLAALRGFLEDGELPWRPE